MINNQVSSFMRFVIVAVVGASIACGAKEKNGGATQDPDPAVTPPPQEQPLRSQFQDSIDPILSKNCGGCHSSGAKHSVFVGDEAAFVAAGEAIAARITSSNPKEVMPPERHRSPQSAEEIQTLLAFLGRL